MTPKEKDLLKRALKEDGKCVSVRGNMLRELHGPPFHWTEGAMANEWIEQQSPIVKAAPKLLEALKKTRETLMGLYSDFDRNFPDVQQAIAEAEGNK